MRVEKWYLDCVAADGAGMIGYAARISWGPLAARCAETLLWGADQQPALNRTVLGGALPSVTVEGVHWLSPAVRAQGWWRPLGPGLAPVILHAEAAGKIEWTACCPAARVGVTIGDQRREGLGYAERLVLTLPPARLPLRELRWGRFIAEGQNCAWIRWRGPRERCWGFHNGRPVEATMPVDDELGWNGHRLQLDRGRTLRTGRVADTVFKDAPWLRRLVPAPLRNVEETKWCSRGVLTDSQGQAHAGWAIHEIALFP